MPDTIPAGLKWKASNFFIQGEKVDYLSYSGSKEPEDGFGNVGDVYHISTENLYYRAEEGWVEGTDSETQHPVHGKMAFLSFTRGKACWVLAGTLRSRKAKEGGAAKSVPGGASLEGVDEGSMRGGHDEPGEHAVYFEGHWPSLTALSKYLTSP